MRGELPEHEAREFEELYFQDERLARLVEAEQILQQAPDLIGTRRLDERNADRWVTRAFREPRYAYAAGIVLVGMLGGLLALGSFNQALREENARIVAASAHPSVADSVVRLSALRGGRDEEPAFTVQLPESADRFITLLLPVPSIEATGAPASVTLSRRGGGEVWQREVDAAGLASQVVPVNLPGGAVEPGDYVIALRRHEGAAEAIMIAKYAFRVASE